MADVKTTRERASQRATEPTASRGIATEERNERGVER